MPSKKRIDWYAASEIWLEPSLSEPLRSTIRLSGSPLETSVRRRLDTRPEQQRGRDHDQRHDRDRERVRAGRGARLRSA